MGRLGHFRFMLAIYRHQMPFVLAVERAWIDAHKPIPF
jgi:hypothetical protein